MAETGLKTFFGVRVKEIVGKYTEKKAPTRKRWSHKNRFRNILGYQSKPVSFGIANPVRLRR